MKYVTILRGTWALFNIPHSRKLNKSKYDGQAKTDGLALCSDVISAVLC